MKQPRGGDRFGRPAGLGVARYCAGCRGELPQLPRYTPVMEPSPELVNRLRREGIEAARKQTLAEKFWAGAELFDYACEIAKAGIRIQHPDFNEEQVPAELRRRIAIGESLEGGQ